MKQYVKKIWSWNPPQYKFIALETAIINYEMYILDCIESKREDVRLKENYPKKFEVWLKTEI